MTLHTVVGTPRSQKEILNEFFDDLSKRGWKHVAAAMDWVQIMENGRARYYLVGSRAMGCGHPKSDLDVLCDGMEPVSTDFAHGGVTIELFYKDIGNRWTVYGNPICKNEKLIALAKLPGRSVELQLRRDTKDWKTVWERIMQHHLAEMRQFALLPKKERRQKQTFLMKTIEYELGLTVIPPERRPRSWRQEMGIETVYT